MRVQAKYAGKGNLFTKGATYQINVDTAFFGNRIKVYPHKRISTNVKRGGYELYDNMSAFLDAWVGIVNKTHEELAAIAELHENISSNWLSDATKRK